MTLALLLAASAARAQSADEPSLAFTINGGLTTGGSLWSIDKWTLTPPTSPQPPFDTVAIARRRRPGLVASLAMSYYRSPNLGLNIEVAYFGLGTEQRCSPQSPFLGPANGVNEQSCQRANGLHAASSVIGFMPGLTYRFFGDSRVQPYVRANAGLGLLGSSFVLTQGIVHDSSCNTSDDLCNYPLLLERSRASATWLVSLATGISYSLGPGYRVRMEFRDLIVALPQVTGPSPALQTRNLIADTKNTVKHVPMFIIGFDVLLERRHTRRY